MAIKKKWPEVYREDCKSVKGDKTKLGRIFVTKIKKPHNRIGYVVGMYAQYDFGAEKRQVDYEALYCCLENLKRDITPIDPGLVIGIPKGMCSGLAGGDWDVVLAMIRSVFPDSEPYNIIICKK